MAINKNTLVHAVMIDPRTGIRRYLNRIETKRNERGEIVLWPVTDSDPAYSRRISYEMAVIFKNRMWQEHRNKVFIALSAGDSADFISE
jgi:hypothetical protein